MDGNESLNSHEKGRFLVKINIISPPTDATNFAMDDLNSFKERLETNLNVLNKFEGLEMDLIQQHGSLRAQVSEYREAIEKATGIDEQDKREHYNHHDEYN